MGKYITEEIKNKIIEFYLSKPMSLKDVRDKFGYSHPTICKILKDVPKYSKNLVYSPNLIESYFENIDTEEKAYFLGLIISDGNIFIPKENSSQKQAKLSITLDLKDEYMLEKFIKCVNSSTVVAKDGRGCGTAGIVSDKMAKDLETYGIIPRKSFNTFLPKNIPEYLYNHLIRGILDGDGSLQCFINNKTNKHIHRITFCGTHQLMEDISNKISECLNIKNQMYMIIKIVFLVKFLLKI